MDEPTSETGRPDETWDEKSRAEYEAIKAKILAEMPDAPGWIGQPTISMDELMEELERLHAEAEASGGTT